MGDLFACQLYRYRFVLVGQARFYLIFFYECIGRVLWLLLFTWLLQFQRYHSFVPLNFSFSKIVR